MSSQIWATLFYLCGSICFIIGSLILLISAVKEGGA